MGNADSKLYFRKAIVQLISKTQPIDASDDSFWEQFWGEHDTSIQDVFTLIPATEIRALREEAPSNLATLCYKAVEKLVHASDTGCSTVQEQTQVLNCVRILTRIVPHIFEDSEWRGFFWSRLPDASGKQSVPLAHSLIFALCDLLFCPDFTVSPNKKSGPDKHEDLQSIDSCEYIWEAGVGFAHPPARVAAHLNNRTEILKLILTCFSQTIYQNTPTGVNGSTSSSESNSDWNRWVLAVTSARNRHALPLFTSLLNVVCAYDPVGIGLPYNHLLFADAHEPLVQVALQILITTLDYEATSPEDAEEREEEDGDFLGENLFVNYLSRLHREEDLAFVLRGFTRLLTNPLQQTYLPHSAKKVDFHQELLVFFWKFCDYNKKFLFYVLKSSDVLNILVPILYHLNDARADQSRVGLMHIGVFILLLLSGERNFGVRLNKPYTASVPMDIPVFTGTHADLLMIVFHKIITTGQQRLQPLFDCLLTIVVNVSPYLKTLSMVSATKIVHLLEAFSAPWFVLAAPHHHHLVFFLLEAINNLVQYQFDGNAALVYAIIRKRHVFHALAALPSENSAIQRAIGRRTTTSFAQSRVVGSTSSNVPQTMEGAQPARAAQPGTKTASLPVMPRLDKMTERESAHPTSHQLNQLTASSPSTSPTDDLIVPVTPSSPRKKEFNYAEAEPKLHPRETKTDVEVDAITPTHAPQQPSQENRRKEKLERVSSPTQSYKSTGSSTGSRGGAVMGINLASGASTSGPWVPSSSWVSSWKAKLPLQTIMRLLQVLVPQVEKICIDKGLTDESEILRFLQHGTLVGLLPVPHPILIRKYQANAGTAAWFRTYMWGVIYLRNVDPPIWYDTDVKLFEIQRV